MNAGAVVLQLVVYGNNNCVTPIGFDQWPRQLPVNSQGDALNAIRGNCGIGDIEVVVNGPTSLRSELVVVGRDIRTTVWQQAALTVARDAVFVKGFAPENWG